MKPGRVYARELAPPFGNFRDGPPLLGPSLMVRVPLRRRTQTPGAVQRVTGLRLPEKVPRLMCGYSGPRSPSCYVGRFAQRQLCRLTAGLAVGHLDLLNRLSETDS